MIVRISRLQLRMYISILEKRTGINSQQYDNSDKHTLLWDFDRVSLSKITKSLMLLQRKYKLPNIMIIQSSVKGSFHAYCFTARTFREVIHILSDTPEIDITYLRLGMVRGYFTLRITPRKNEPNFKVVRTLMSVYPNETNINSMTINEYLTNNKGGKNVKK